MKREKRSLGVSVYGRIASRLANIWWKRSSIQTGGRWLRLASYIGNSIVVCQRANAAGLANPSRLCSKETRLGELAGSGSEGKKKVGRNKRTPGTNYSHRRRFRRRRRRSSRRQSSLPSTRVSRFINLKIYIAVPFALPGKFLSITQLLFTIRLSLDKGGQKLTILIFHLAKNQEGGSTTTGVRLVPGILLFFTSPLFFPPLILPSRLSATAKGPSHECRARGEAYHAIPQSYRVG